MGGDYELLNSGCCGMAGSFGFEADKYRASVEIGERTLLPKVREAAPEAILVADGFSCREQVEQLTDRHALHTAEVVSMAMHNKFPEAGNPEAEVVGLRRRELQRSRRRAGIALALGAAGAAALSMLWARRRD
jgi:ferric-dicitrate binding protein FerR (iron transport regulator)